jgi:hypothetical protein
MSTKAVSYNYHSDAHDFCIDEDAGVAYVTTHSENTIDCISLNPAKTANVISSREPRSQNN